MDKTIYFLRHGETDLNLKGIVQGSGVDSDLNKTGKLQAKIFYEFYKNVPFDLLIASGLKRSVQTIESFGKNGLTIEKSDLINEINWGVHEGKPSKGWMIEAYKKMVAEWNIGNFDASLEDGESARQLAERISLFLENIKLRTKKNLLVCTHGRTLRCIMCLLKGEHLREMEKYTHTNTGLFKVHWKDQRFEVELENDIRHLKEAER